MSMIRLRKPICFLEVLVISICLTGCDDDLPEAPSKEQVIKYVQAQIGMEPERKIIWYVPYKPETQTHGSSSKPARSYVLYEQGGYCFLHDISTPSPRFFVPCNMAMPPGAVTP